MFLFFCAEPILRKRSLPPGQPGQRPSQPAPSLARSAGARRQAPRQPPPLPGRVPAGLRSVSPSPFLCFVFLFLVYFLSPTPSLLSPHLYKYPHTPSNTSNQTLSSHQPQAPHHPTPSQAAPHPAPLTTLRHPSPTAAALRHAAGAPHERPRRRLPRISFPRIVFF